MNDTTRRLYKLSQGVNTISINFPEINKTYKTQDIEGNNVTLNEALMNGDNIEFVGCISNYFQTRIHGADAELKDKKVIVTIDKVGLNDPIKIFEGYVFNAPTRSDLAYKEITCFDVLHKKTSDKDVSTWYNSLNFPMKMKAIRDSFWNYIGIQQVQTKLANDDIVIDKQYDPHRMNALDVAKSICQFNGVCGIITRDNKFDYRIPYTKDTYYPPYPGVRTFPGSKLFPASADSVHDYVEENFFYESMQYEEYQTAKITRVEVRDDIKSKSFGYGSGTNKYIIQGNIFVYGLTDANKVKVAQNIYNKIKDFQYRPVNYTAPGLPFAEVGSVQSFYAMDWLNGSGEKVRRTFPLLNRTLRGMNELKDSCNIRGKKEQTEFVSSLNVKVDLITKEGDYYTKDEMDRKLERDYYTKDQTDDVAEGIVDTAIAQMETPTGLAFASVYTLPAAPRANTLYGIQCGVIVVE